MFKTILDFAEARQAGRAITMSTCYDAWSAKLLAASEVDALLVGDSVAMVVHGFPTTVHADVEMMAWHTAAVRRGAGEDAFVVADLPFPVHRMGIESAMRAVDQLMKAGASAVKLEGARGHLDAVEHIVVSGAPVMGHLGLTPQSVNQFGGYKVQGREQAAAEQLLADAKALQDAGCFSLVLECVPRSLAQKVTEALAVPTIGIGSGATCSGQVLVLQDLLGLLPGFKPKFVRHWMDGADALTKAVNAYVTDVREGTFPSEKESFK